MHIRFADVNWLAWINFPPYVGIWIQGSVFMIGCMNSIETPPTFGNFRLHSGDGHSGRSTSVRGPRHLLRGSATGKRPPRRNLKICSMTSERVTKTGSERTDDRRAPRRRCLPPHAPQNPGVKSRAPQKYTFHGVGICVLHGANFIFYGATAFRQCSIGDCISRGMTIKTYSRQLLTFR
jgi:hypothetical protein